MRCVCLKGTIMVFHCPKESNNWHSNGCDLCQGCADWAVGMQQMNPQQYGAAQGFPMQYTEMTQGVVPQNMGMFQAPNATQMAMNVQNSQFEFDQSDTNAKKHLSEMLQSDDSDQKVRSSPFDSESLFESNIIRSTT
eukprot:495202_1